ncbi:hypothetical protein [Colidextribacter sp. OB.20]|uniref:hypothetical protein n=1 Tax=Colidextribacter sp. OB.20 TaxID=2304568 RepID=UPI00136979AD|nr:hypothetical protein [Colidextribacter sp. OB.20]
MDFLILYIRLSQGLSFRKRKFCGHVSATGGFLGQNWKKKGAEREKWKKIKKFEKTY